MYRFAFSKVICGQVNKNVDKLSKIDFNQCHVKSFKIKVTDNNPILRVKLRVSLAKD